MTDEVATALIAGISGAVAGGIASIAAPWVNWRIETKRSVIQRRRELINNWREGVESWSQANRNSSGRDFVESTWFSSLEPHLEPAAVKELGENYLIVELGSDSGPPRRGGPYAKLIRNEINRIESAWGLR